MSYTLMIGSSSIIKLLCRLQPYIINLRLTLKLICRLILELVANAVFLHSRVLPFIDIDTLTVATETSVPLS